MLTARAPPALVEQIEAWARRQKITRSDAIRRLVELGLTVSHKGIAKTKK